MGLEPTTLYTLDRALYQLSTCIRSRLYCMLVQRLTHLYLFRSPPLPQQMQFAIILAHVSLALYYDCRYDTRPQWALVVYMLSHLALFSNFYKHTYLGPMGGKKRRERENGGRAVANGDAHLQDDSPTEKKEQ